MLMINEHHIDNLLFASAPTCSLDGIQYQAESFGSTGRFMYFGVGTPSATHHRFFSARLAWMIVGTVTPLSPIDMGCQAKLLGLRVADHRATAPRPSSPLQVARKERINLTIELAEQ